MRKNKEINKNVLKMNALLWAVLLALSLGSCSASDASDAPRPAPSGISGEQVVMPYFFIPQDEVEGWREPLMKLLLNTESRIDSEGEGVEYVAPNPNEPAIPYGHYYALFQVNGDDTPELLVDLGGGTAGNAFYEAYDIYTGECVGQLSGGCNEDSWCYYYHAEDGTLGAIEHTRLRLGWAGAIDGCYMMVYKNGGLEDGGYLGISYEHRILNDKLFDSNGSLVVNTETVVWDINACGVEIDIERYIDARIELERTWIRIPETTMRVCSTFEFASGEDVDPKKSREEQIVDQLLNGEQRFLRFPKE